MANFIIPYTTPVNYTYDNTKIEVSGGLAQLKDLTPLNETFFANYNTNINGNRGLGVLTGIAFGGASVSGGKLDLKGGTVKYVDYDADLNADSQQTGTIRLLVTPNYSGTPSTHQFFFTISSPTGDGLDNDIRFGQLSTGSIALFMYDFGSNVIINATFGTWVPVAGTEYEFELNYDITSGATRIFIDGVQIGGTSPNTGTRSSNIDFIRIGSDGAASPTTTADFEIDNFQVFNTVQHTSNYTPESPPENKYANDSPTIYKTLGDSIADIEVWVNFLETLGIGNEGSIQYQLSEDAITWYYWNGVAWAVAGVSDYNIVNIVNTNITTFPTVVDKIFAKAFLISDGDQKVELDLNEIGYTINTIPIVYAGTNKNVIYNVSTTPFSDAIFSDAEGNIVKAEWKEEGGAYAEIPQGGHATLLEAVQAFDYTPTHSGNKTLYLKITDSFDAFAEDDLIVNVNQVTVTVNIKNSDSYDLTGVIFTPGDGGSASSQDSPFSYTYLIGTHTTICTKTGFVDLSQSVTISIAVSEVNLIMVEKTPLSDLIISVDWPVNFHLGDSVNIPCDVDGDLTGYKIRCEFFDNSCNEIKLGNSASGGSESEIADTVLAQGKFLIQVAEDLTTDFDKKAFIEIELEDTDGDKYTIYRAEFRFKKEEITWTDPTA